MNFAAPNLEIYYDTHKKQFLKKNPHGRWQELSDSGIHERLIAMGYDDVRSTKENRLSECDLIRHHITDHNDISFSGSIAGHTEGFYDKNGVRYVVTDSPTFIGPKAGEWNTIKELLLNMFGQRECNVLFAWLKIAITDLRSGEWTQQQALAIAGEAACGKSFIQNNIITPCLGGRSAKCARYMLGKTQFNADLFQAEHLVVDDEFVSHRIGDRIAFGANIKKVTVSSDSESLHGKGKNAISITPFWRISITLNDNPESLQVLPPLNEDIVDKFIILKAVKNKFPMPTETSIQKKKFLDAIRTELPAFIHYLLNAFVIPKDLIGNRYGIKSYQNQEILESLSDLAPENALLRLLDTAFDEEIRMEANDIRDYLFNNSKTSSEARTLLDGWNNKTGTYLGRLAAKYPDRVKPPTNNKNRKYTILKVKTDEEELAELLSKL